MITKLSIAHWVTPAQPHLKPNQRALKKNLAQPNPAAYKIAQPSPTQPSADPNNTSPQRSIQKPPESLDAFDHFRAQIQERYQQPGSR